MYITPNFLAEKKKSHQLIQNIQDAKYLSLQLDVLVHLVSQSSLLWP